MHLRLILGNAASEVVSRAFKKRGCGNGSFVLSDEGGECTVRYALGLAPPGSDPGTKRGASPPRSRVLSEVTLSLEGTPGRPLCQHPCSVA